MKPLIILVDRIGKEGEITISKSDLEKYILDAYNSGHSDGFSEGYAEGLNYRDTITVNPWANQPYYTTSSGNALDHSTRITCNSSLASKSNDISYNNNECGRKSYMSFMYLQNLE